MGLRENVGLLSSGGRQGDCPGYCGYRTAMARVYEDAQKEFSLTSMTGFGADGSKTEQQLDFEQVRGVFESNPFVTAVLEHIKVKTALGNELIDRLKGLLNENEA